MKMITTLKTIQCFVLSTFMGTMVVAQDKQITDDQQAILNGEYVPQTVNNTASLSSSKDQSNVFPLINALSNTNKGLQQQIKTTAGTDQNAQMRLGSLPCDESITAPFARDNQFAGNMFDVTASGGTAVMIDGFDVNLNNVGTGADIKIYYRTDSYVGNEGSNAGWVLLGEDNVTSAGTDTPTPVEIGGLLIPAGETYGMYVLVENHPTVAMQYTNIPGNTTIADSFLTLELGVGKATPEFTGNTYADRRWNGTIHYSTTDCDPYCGPLNFTSAVEPITDIYFAGLFGGALNNGDINGVPPHQYWMEIESLYDDFGIPNVIQQVTPGQTYPMTLAGNTDGNFTNRFVVFIDWNQNGVLDDAGEVYEFTQTIQNSTGVDGQFAMHDIAVPEDALTGNTRMRIKKIFGTSNFLDPCMGTSYGHVQDFDIRVVPPAAGASGCQVALTGFYNGFDAIAGNMFDITNNFTDDISIEAFDINFFNEGTTTDAEISVYYRSGSHVGFEESPAGWSTMGQQTITANTATDINAPTKIDQLTPLTIQPGETYGIYIAVSNDEGMLVTSVQAEGRYMENDHILMEAGAVVEHPDFSVAYLDSGFWNGTIYYCSSGIMSVEQPDAAFDFNFYPNPVENVLNLNASQPMESLSIYTINGQEVMQQQLNNTSSQIEVSHLKPGFYLMNVKINGQSQTHRLLIK